MLPIDIGMMSAFRDDFKKFQCNEFDEMGFSFLALFLFDELRQVLQFHTLVIHIPKIFEIFGNFEVLIATDRKMCKWSKDHTKEVEITW